jgi:hypothetical protein
VVRKRCRYCGSWFIADPRVGDRQKACSTHCQRLRKKENNRIFSKNNPGYWRGRYDYVKRWRQKHPDYQRQWRANSRQQGRSQFEIQAEMLSKAIEFTERTNLYLREIQAEILPKALGIVPKKAPLILQAH